jgi:hypothetical protein
VLVLIKSLIYTREEEDTLEARLNKINQSRSKLSADTSHLVESVLNNSVAVKALAGLFTFDHLQSSFQQS